MVCGDARVMMHLLRRALACVLLEWRADLTCEHPYSRHDTSRSSQFFSFSSRSLATLNLPQLLAYV